jgi:hypothetical protein
MSEQVDLGDLPPVLTPQDVCHVLRKDVKRPCQAVRALERSGLRVLRVGRDLRVLRKDLEAFLVGADVG